MTNRTVNPRSIKSVRLSAATSRGLPKGHGPGNSKFRCPECGETTGIYDSRPFSDGKVVKRRRACAGCGFRFTTHEVMAGGEAPHIAAIVRQTAAALRETAADLDALLIPRDAPE